MVWFSSALFPSLLACEQGIKVGNNENITEDVKIPKGDNIYDPITGRNTKVVDPAAVNNTNAHNRMNDMLDINFGGWSNKKD